MGQFDDRRFSLLPIPVDAVTNLNSLPLTFSPAVQVPLHNCPEEAVFKGQNMGSTAVGGKGILHTHLSFRLSPSSLSFPCWRSDSPPFFIPGSFDNDILPTPHISTRLPCPSSLRPSGSSPWLAPPQKVSSTPASRSTPSSIGMHPLPFSPLPSPHFPPSSPHQPPALASIPCPSPTLPCLPALLVLLHSLFLHPHQVTRVLCHVLSWLTLTVTVCLYVGLSSLFLLFPFSFLQVSVEELV